VSHVLLPVFALLRRADLVEVIGAALSAKAAGVGARTIAVGLGRPVETVRGWLRSFARGGSGAAGVGAHAVRGRGGGGAGRGGRGPVTVATHR
jgi:hypothetical protein